jgi:serine protease AprX
VQPGYIEISIFDLTGKKIETLVSGIQEAGEHRVSWKVEKYASGVYIYKLSGAQGTVQRKCLLVK